ncbi:MAG: PorV/PorQ family protein [Rhodothermales bacterium]
MMKYGYATILMCVVLALPVHAQETGLNFLRIGANAAAGAMGDAQVAGTRDAFATYWNPAGLASAPFNSAAVSHRIWLADMRAYDVAARFRVGRNGGLGLALTAVDSGDLEVRDAPGDPDGVFSAQFISVGLSYGRQVGPLRAGVTAKYLSEQIFEQTATGYAFDAGVQVGVLGDKLLFGAALQNVGKMNKLAGEASTLPKTLRVGTAFSPFRILAENDGSTLLDVLLAAEVSHLFPGETTRFHAGGGVEVLDLVVLRAGIITNDALRNVTFGGGLHYGAFFFDYAFLPFESGFEGPGHVLTLHYTW